MGVHKLEHTFLGGYELMDRLGQGAFSVVYRAKKDEKLYALKVFQITQSNDLNVELNLRKEAALASTLKHPNLINIVEIGLENGQPFMATDILDAKTLEEWVQESSPNQDQILKVIIQVCQGLNCVHSRGLLHRDIKPSNILVDSSLHATIIDFGFLGAEGGSSEAGHFTGTLNYSSPEAMGLLQTPVDQRSDLYSLGVTLFEMLAGQHPYPSTDTTELLQKIGRSEPQDIRDISPNLSPALAHIVRKLLEKDPDDRYQSALGLAHDLENLDQLDSEVKSGSFKLDRHAGSSGRGQEMELVGRRSELEGLKSAYEQSKDSGGRHMLLAGAGGTGKSRLAAEFIKYVRAANGVVLQGKCQKNDSTPLGSIREALDSFFLKAADAPREEQSKLFEYLDSRKGKDGFFLRGLSRFLNNYYAEEEPLRMLDPESQKEKFFNLSRDFLIGLSSVIHPMTLWIDDVQWVDSSSKEILSRLSFSASGHKIFLLFTARNDSESAESLSNFNECLNPGSGETLSLLPLTTNDVEDLIANFLGRGRLPEEVVARIYSSSNGNPFATIEILRAMIDGGCLVPVSNGWHVDLEAFSLLNFSNSVVDLIAQRIDQMPKGLTDILSLGAVSGNVFDLEMLESIKPESTSIKSQLEVAITGNLVFKMSERQYSFVHDCAREAILKSFPQKDLERTHVEIGLYLYSTHKDRPDYVYKAAKHLMSGYGTDLPPTFGPIGAEAAKYALENHAWNDAYKILDLLYQHRDTMLQDQLLLVEVGQALATCANSLGLHAHCYKVLDDIIPLCASKESKTNALHLYSVALLGEGRFSESEKLLAKTLSVAGVKIPKHPLLRTLQSFLILGSALFLFWTGWLKGDGSLSSGSRRRKVSDIFLTAKYLSYFQGNIFVLMDILFRDLLNAHFIGPGPEYARSHIAFSYPIALIGLGRLSRYHLRLGMSMATKIEDKYSLAFGYFIGSLTVAANGDHMAAENALKEKIGDIEADGPIHEKSSAHNCIAYMKMFKGDTRGSLAHIMTNMEKVDQWNNHVLRTNFKSSAYTQLMMLGRTKEAIDLKKQALEAASLVPDSKYCWFLYHGNHLSSLIETNDLGDEMDTTIGNIHKIPVLDYFGRWCFVVVARARLAQTLYASTPKAKAQRFTQFKMAFWISRILATTDNHRCHVMVLKGYYYLLKGQNRRALKTLREASALAVEADCPMAIYEAQLAQARAATALGKTSLCRYHAQRAHGIAMESGWTFRSDVVKKEFSDIVNFSADSLKRSYVGESRSGSFDLKSSNYTDVLLRVAEVCSSSLDPEEQTRKVLDELIVIMNAERAFLFLLNDNGELLLRGGRNSSKEVLSELGGHSSTFIRKIQEGLEPMLVTGTDQAEAIGSESAIHHNLRSIIGAPLLVRGDLKGVLYLDSRIAKGLFSQKDLEILAAVSAQVAIALETTKLVQVEANERAMKKDLELSGAVQRMLLPRSQSYHHSTFSLHGSNTPAAQCGGDWWWYQHQDDTLELFVGDVTGHGAGSAMITSSVAATIACLKSIDSATPIDHLLGSVHGVLNQLAQGTYLMTGASARINLNTLEMDFCSAAAFPLFVVQPDGVCEQVICKSSPLGFHDLTLGRKKIQLLKGSRLCLMTDGTSETSNPKGRQFGERKLAELLKKTREKSPELATKEIISVLDLYRGGPVPEDDVTIVLLDIV